MASKDDNAKRLRFTNRNVAALKAENDKKTRYWDTDVKELFVIVRPSGTRTFSTRYRLNGKQLETVIGRHGKGWTVETARIRAREIQNDAGLGKDPVEREEEAAADLTVTELIDLYLKEGPIDKPDKRQSSWDNDKSYLNNHAKPLLGKKRISTLKPSILSKWQNDVLTGKSARPKPKHGRGRAAQGGPGAAAHATRSFSACLGWAVRREFLESNPFDKIEKAQDGHRERYLSTDEAKRIFAAISALHDEGEISADKVDVIELLFYSAARLSEILALRWTEVDLERAILLLPPARHKTGNKKTPKVIPITKPMLTILKRRRKMATKDAEFVFPSDKSKKLGRLTNVRDEWAKILKHAEISDFRIHDFRHAYASFAINAGMSLKMIGANLGHKKASTTERYAHLLVEARRPVADHVSDLYQELRGQ